MSPSCRQVVELSHKSCWSRYARFSGVSFVLVKYMSATLFMSCSM